MKIDYQSIQSLCPGLSKDVVEEYLGRLDDDYVDRFDIPTVAQHLQGLSRLSSQNPVEVILTDRGGSAAECTVLAFDHPFEFSVITGVLAGTGLRIDRGEVFTLRRATKGRPGPDVPRRLPVYIRRRFLRRRHARSSDVNTLRQPVIIDYFSGQRTDDQHNFEGWANRLKASLTEAIKLLDRDDQESVERSKHRVNELVTERLAKLGSTPDAALLPINVEIDQNHEGRTRLKISAQDTPAFLYSLSTALSLNGLSIERVHIESNGGMVEDEVHVVDAEGQPIVDEQLLERVRLSVLLTKQFTYFLDRAPDPFTALTRFEQLTEQILELPQRGQWIDQLSNPRTMQHLAKLLGTSDFLWEDFIRAQYEALLPIFKPHLEGRQFSQPAETLPLRMRQSLEGAPRFEDQQDQLNKFKDQEIFLIDLDHILTPGSDFRELSERLTLLAENLVSAAANLVYEHLVRSYGEPSTVDQQVPYAVFGLGKLGGVALGYASDIELLFLCPGNGNTRGRDRHAITNAEFFEHLARETSQFIKTKREGIFQVDLRLRPYGNDGPLASTAEQFRSYYGSDGPAHPFEKLALVRMRWIAGDPQLGFEIEQLRDQIVYDGPDLDLDALWEVWEKQHEQKSKPFELNAKYSSGSLVDLESAVQLLQVMHAQKAPQLRTPRLHEAMEGLRRAGILSVQEYADLSGAYIFLRRLINALRMLRGSAQDLFLPPMDSDELVHLARRMGYSQGTDQNPASQLLDEFQARTKSVRQFVNKHFERPCPGETV